MTIGCMAAVIMLVTSIQRMDKKTTTSSPKSSESRASQEERYGLSFLKTTWSLEIHIMRLLKQKKYNSSVFCSLWSIDEPAQMKFFHLLFEADVLARSRLTLHAGTCHFHSLATQYIQGVFLTGPPKFQC